MSQATFVDAFSALDRKAELLIPIVPLVTPEEAARLLESERFAAAQEYARDVRHRHGILA